MVDDTKSREAAGNDNGISGQFARDHHLPPAGDEEPIFDANGNLTPYGEWLARKNGFVIVSRLDGGLTDKFRG